MYRQIIKRTADFIIAILAFIILFPVFLVVTIVLAVVNGGKAFFLQERPGKHAQVFHVIKFKTMSDRKDAAGNLLPDSARLTKAGSFVRKTSLDEIPQLLNVIKGDMSLIGPRPLLVEYLPHYTERQKKRHEVRPGITGLAQVKGRNNLRFSHRFKYDVFYVEHLTFGMDLLIIWQTMLAVFGKTREIRNAQGVDEVDDLGISVNLGAHHFNDKERFLSNTKK